MSTVLIVDDEAVTVKLLETLLELDGFNVAVARRGIDVLPVLEAQAVDVMMIDYHLTDTEGTTIIRDIRADDRFKHLPIVMASGMDKSQEAREAGADEFILKPFEPADLPNLFNRLIGE